MAPFSINAPCNEDGIIVAIRESSLGWPCSDPPQPWSIWSEIDNESLNVLCILKMDCKRTGCNFHPGHQEVTNQP